MSDKRRLTVELDKDLFMRLKHLSIDRDKTMTTIVAEILVNALAIETYAHQLNAIEERA